LQGRPIQTQVHNGRRRIGGKMYSDLPRRKPIRLKDYDYSQAGYYFVTICTKDRKNILCEIVGNDALVVPSAIGEKIIHCWNNISGLSENIKADLFCLMPNHVHGIITIVGNDALIVPDKNDSNIKIEKKHGFETTERWGHRSLQGIIRDFKSVTTRVFNKMVDTSLKNMLWQNSFYEHIIRNEQELQKIREYIINNPVNWQGDKYFV
jgi:putative transposase